MPSNRKLRQVAGQGAGQQAGAIFNLGSLAGGVLGAFYAMPVLKPLLSHWLPKSLMHIKLDLNIGPVKSVNMVDGLVLFIGFVGGYAIAMIFMVIVLNVISKAQGAMASSDE